MLAEAARLGYHAEAKRWLPAARNEAALVRRWRARNVRGVPAEPTTLTVAGRW